MKYEFINLTAPLPSYLHMQYTRDLLPNDWKNSGGKKGHSKTEGGKYWNLIKLCVNNTCVMCSHLLSVKALWLKWRMSWWRGSGWISATSSSSSSTIFMGVFCRSPQAETVTSAQISSGCYTPVSRAFIRPQLLFTHSFATNIESGAVVTCNIRRHADNFFWPCPGDPKHRQDEKH